MIKAIVFDFFGVICSDDYWRYVKAGRETDKIFRTYADKVNLGSMTWQDFITKVAEATNTSVNEVNKLYSSERIDPRVVGLIHHLKRDYKTGLLTNAHHQYITPLLEQDIMKGLFDAVIISSQVGVVKPNPKIFEFMLDELGLKPGEVVYIDDLERHVSAAEALGITAIHYKSFEQLQEELGQIINHK